MRRRIAAGIFSFMLLLNLVLPVGAIDTTDTTVYPIGYKDMWVVGLETVPTAATEYPGVWRPVYKADGVTRESKPGTCPLHACDAGCFDALGNKNCGVVAGEEHTHNIKCSVEAIVKYASYQWQVVAPEGSDEDDDNNPQETRPEEDDFEEEFDDGSTSLYIKNVGTDNQPLVGTEFLLLEVRVKQDPENPENTITDEFVKAYGATVERNGNAVAHLKGIRITGEADRVTWKLIQNALEGDLSNKYHTNTTEWEVTIVRDSEGKHTIESVQPVGYIPETDSDGMAVAYPQYDQKLRTLTVENELLTGTLKVDVYFEGFGDTIPAGVESTVTVDMPGSGPVELKFPMSQARYYIQQNGLYELNLGTYTVTASAPVEVEGYTAEDPFIKVHQPVEADGTSGNSAHLDKDHLAARFTVTYKYAVACDHKYNAVEYAATCTTDGYTQYICECGATYEEKGEPATGHNHEMTVVDPTCTLDGYLAYTCVNPGCSDTYKIDGEPATGHNFDITNSDPTCTEPGYKIVACINDGCEENSKEVVADPLGHSYKETVVQPTCTDKGYTEYVCVVAGCGYSYQDTEVAATGHKYKDVIVDPTCTEKGYTEHTCVNEGCGYNYQDTEVAATGHKYKDVIVDPTCTEKGYTEHTCVNEGCGYNYQDTEVAATGHKYKDVIVDPTCTEKGYTEHTCVNEGCSDSYRDTEKAACGHKYTEEKLDGRTRYTCSGCGDSYEDDNPNDEKPSTTEPATGENTGSAVVNQSNIIVIRAVDDQGNPLEKTEIGLFNDKKAVRTWTATYDNVFILDDLEKLAESGKSVSYTLKQIKAPAGHRLADETYKVTINAKNAEVQVDIKKNASSLDKLFKGSGVEVGTDGKQIATFISQRKTTQIELRCETVVNVAADVWQDKQMITQFQEKPYEFILTWKNMEGEIQEERILIEDEEATLLEAEIPFGVDYALTALNEDGTYVVTLSENAAGSIDAEKIRDVIAVNATRQYFIESGNPLTIDFTTVDAQSKRPIQGAAFVLSNGDGIELATYVSDTNGDFRMTDVFGEPGDYVLTETQTAEGYQLLATPVRIEVTQQYTLDNTTTKPIHQQTMTAKIVSNAVVEESDGSFWIENGLLSDERTEEKTEKTGTGAIVGIAAAAVAGLVGLGAVLYRKKRKK